MERSLSTLSAVPEAAEYFNPSRFAVARKRRGLTRAEVAAKLGVTPRAVTGYELGENSPRSEVLHRIPSVLGFPLAFFYGDDLDEPDALDVSFRSLTNMTAKTRDMALSQGALAILLARWMECRFELPKCALPNLTAESSPEAAAEALRECWALGQLPIKNMVHLLESKGVRVFSIAVEAREVDAFSTWKGEIPYVFLNSYKSSEHSRFDAAHELGHLVMHRHGGPAGRQAELEAHRFASAFLMPRGSVLAHAPKFATIAELRSRKKIWITSVAALNQRLRELDLISEWHHRNLCIEISKRGYRRHEPDSAPKETSLIFPKMFASLYQEDGMSRTRIADELQIPIAELEQLLFSLVMTGVSGGRAREKKVGNPSLLHRVK